MLYSTLLNGLILGFFVPALAAMEVHPLRPIYLRPSSASEAKRGFDSNSVEEDLHRTELAERSGVLKDIPRLNERRRWFAVTAAYTVKNRETFMRLHRRSFEIDMKTASHLLSNVEADQLRNEVIRHRIVGDLGLKKYDADESEGFCFGRAAYIHLLLSKRGVPQNQMVKVFVLGSLHYGPSLWKDHVATLVLGKNPQGKVVWWAIDPLLPKVFTLDEWAKKIGEFSIRKQSPDLRFYSTDPKKFLAAAGEYRRDELIAPEFNGFFVDLVREFGVTDLQPGPQLKP